MTNVILDVLFTHVTIIKYTYLLTILHIRDAVIYVLAEFVR